MVDCSHKAKAMEMRLFQVGFLHPGRPMEYIKGIDLWPTTVKVTLKTRRDTITPGLIERGMLILLPKPQRSLKI